MSIALAAAWYPRGELPRFWRLLPVLQQVYDFIVIYLSQNSDPEVRQALTSGELPERYGLLVISSEDWRSGRTVVLQAALQTPASHIHYVDMDRLLRWVETRQQEWQQTMQRLEGCDCLVMGRTAAAYSTHPQALLQTEAVSNLVVSHWLDQAMDVSGGSKGFSRRAAELLTSQADPCPAYGTDAEWPIRLKRAGYRVDYIEVDGLDWESADQFQERAADAERQRKLALAYDQNPQNWSFRVGVAMEIVKCALNLMGREHDR